MSKIFLLVGVPGSGKSWVCSQLQEYFHYIPHDDFIEDGHEAYLEAIELAAQNSTRQILIETPFSISQTLDPLLEAGHEVEAVFIIEEEEILSERYLDREGKTIPGKHLKRQETYRERAEEYDSFVGTSDEVLEYLQSECTRPATWPKKLVSF